ncbi:MAG: class I SAM-dependent methyltransferase [bacterium]
MKKRKKSEILNRTGILNYLIKLYNYKHYLEIGVRNPDENFNLIKAKYKAGVDPDGNCRYPMTPDSFFKINKNTYDIIFIDGFHQDQQVIKDIDNSLNVLDENGTIVLHDCNPLEEINQTEIQHNGAWNGTVWKAFAQFRMTRTYLEMYVVDTDWGVGIIRRGIQAALSATEDKLDFAFLENNRKALLNLITTDEFKKLFHHSGFAMINFYRSIFKK